MANPTPSNINAFLGPARALYKQGHFKECVEECDKIIKLGWITGDIYNIMAVALAQLQQYDRAMATINIARIVAPNNPQIVKNKKILEGQIQQNINERDKTYFEYKVQNKVCEWKFENNVNGAEFEKQKDIETAIKFYEANVAARFEGNYPYDRLAIIYSKMKRYEDEKRVLEIAIDVFEHDVYAERGDRSPKLIKFRERLAKVEQKLNKSKLDTV